MLLRKKIILMNFIAQSVLLGSNDLLAEYDMGSSYQRFCGSKRLREDLGSFLPHLVGNFNFENALEFRFLC